MLQIVLVIMGIVGLVRGKINMSKTKELRGTWLYIVCGLFIGSLPLSFVGAFAGAALSGATTQDSAKDAAMIGSIACTLVPIIAGIVFAYVKAQPKTEVVSRGFDVMPPSNQPPKP